MHLTRLSLLLILPILACGGTAAGESDGPVGGPVVVAVDPASPTLQPGMSAQFTAAVTGTSVRTVVWSVLEGAAGGSIGPTGVYVAPGSPGAYHVVATSVADPGASATASVTVTAAPAIVVTVTPKTASISTGASASFLATVTGTSDSRVTWTVREGVSGGSVTTAGVYSAPSTPGVYHVVASSVPDPSRSDEASVTVSDVPAAGSLFLDGMFLIGVYAPPPSDFDKWKGRGINTVVDVPDGDFLVRDWDLEAKARGLKQIRGPMTTGTNAASPTPAADIGNTSLLAWAHIDEPNNFCQTAVRPARIRSEYDAWKLVDPSRVVFTGFSGGDITDCPHNAGWTSDYATYISGTDWIANDRYPVSGYWDNGWPTLDLTRMTDPMDQIAAWTSKPQFTYIESSRVNQTDPAKGVSPAQLRAEIWLAVAHGARGIIYFPELVGNNGFAFDGTTAAVAAEMGRQNATLAALAPVLQGAIDPSTAGVTAPAPLHATWREAPSGKYFIVVNPTANSTAGVRVSLSGIGAATGATVYGESRTVPISSQALTDDFAPYSVHIYVVP